MSSPPSAEPRPAGKPLRLSARLTVPRDSGTPFPMLAKALMKLHRTLVLVILAGTLTAAGFAHRIPTQQDGALAFALANGADASDFCGGSAGSDPAGALHCPACQITAGADLPPLSALVIDLELAVYADVVAPREMRAVLTVQDPAHSPQGPPVG